MMAGQDTSEHPYLDLIKGSSNDQSDDVIDFIDKDDSIKNHGVPDN